MQALFEPTVMEPVIQPTIGYDNEAQTLDINQIPDGLKKERRRKGEKVVGENGENATQVLRQVRPSSAAAVVQAVPPQEEVHPVRDDGRRGGRRGQLQRRQQRGDFGGDSEIEISRKRKNLIVDSFTEIPVDNHAYAEQAHQLHEMFRERNTWRGTRYEFQSIDLIKEPLSMNALKTIRTLNSHQLKMSINYRHLIEYKCLTTESVIDDENFYLTEARDFDARSSTLFPMNLEEESRIEEPMSFAMEPQPLEPMPLMQPLDSYIEGGKLKETNTTVSPR
jgi:hypothetical protein